MQKMNKKDMTLNEKFDVDIFSNTSDTVTIEERKSMAIGNFLPLQNHTVHLTKCSGNFWRICGFSNNAKDYLYPEEALYLVERSFLIVKFNEVTVDYSQFYQQIVDKVSLSFYLTYIKLKSLDYITFRHTCNARSFSGDRDLYEYLERNPTFTLLETLVAFNVYPQSGSFTKRAMRESLPTSYVVVMNSEVSFSPRVMLTLLKEAKGVPVIVAALTNTGHVLLEEFTDALQSLNWTNSVARPMSMLEDPEVDDEEEEEDGEGEEVNDVEETEVVEQEVAQKETAAESTNSADSAVSMDMEVEEESAEMDAVERGSVAEQSLPAAEMSLSTADAHQAHAVSQSHHVVAPSSPAPVVIDLLESTHHPQHHRGVSPSPSPKKRVEEREVIYISDSSE